jgi:hypothetical protein
LAITILVDLPAPLVQEQAGANVDIFRPFDDVQISGAGIISGDHRRVMTSSAAVD